MLRLDYLIEQIVGNTRTFPTKIANDLDRHIPFVDSKIGWDTDDTVASELFKQASSPFLFDWEVDSFFGPSSFVRWLDEAFKKVSTLCCNRVDSGITFHWTAGSASSFNIEEESGRFSAPTTPITTLVSRWNCATSNITDPINGYSNRGKNKTVNIVRRSRSWSRTSRVNINLIWLHLTLVIPRAKC